MRLYSGPMSMFGAKVQIALGEKGADCEVVMVPFGLRRHYDPKHPDILRINPKGQVPVLIDGAVELYDSTQILEYLEDRFAEPPLWPQDRASRAAARLLELQSDEVFFPHVARRMGRSAQPDDESYAAGRAIHAYYNEMEARLGSRDYLAGPYSFADIAFLMAQLFASIVGVPMTSATPRLLAWRSRVANRPAVAAVVRPMVDYMNGLGIVPAEAVG